MRHLQTVVPPSYSQMNTFQGLTQSRVASQDCDKLQNHTPTAKPCRAPNLPKASCKAEPEARSACREDLDARTGCHQDLSSSFTARVLDWQLCKHRHLPLKKAGKSQGREGLCRAAQHKPGGDNGICSLKQILPDCESGEVGIKGC